MKNKNYRLLKDLPTIEAGRIFEETKCSLGGTLLYATGFCSDFTIDKDGIQNFDEWFEEVKEDKEEKFSERIFYILPDGVIDTIETVNYSNTKDNRKEYKEYKEKLKSVGNCFETREEAEKYLEYLKAKAIIKQDAKGFKPDWNNGDETKFFGYWDFILEEPGHGLDYRAKTPNIYFQSPKDIKESFKKHPEEWKTYLTYEQ